MNIAYFGSPYISSVLLKELLKEYKQDFQISLVVSQPDKPVGKRLEIRPTMVSEVAQAYKIPLFKKELKNNEAELIHLMHRYNIKLCIIFAYGEIISKKLLNTPEFGFWNIHPSLLPLYRGSSPVAYSLLLGDLETGVSLIQLEPSMDTGPIIERVKTLIEPHENRNTLEERLTLLGSSLLKQNLKKIIINHKIDTKPQNHILATYTRLLKKEDGYFDKLFLYKALKDEPVPNKLLPLILREYIQKYNNNSFLTKSTGEIFFNFFRSLHPWPGIWTKINTDKGEKRLKIIEVTFNKKLIVSKLQIEGKIPVDFETFIRAYKID